MKTIKKRVDYLLVGILVLSAGLNFYNLNNAGSNTYYTAAVKSMMQNFHAFFYASFDPVGFITVDKPPVALWVQTLSAKIFGLSDFSVLLPEALAGVFSVYLMYILVKPKFGRAASLLSSLVLACSPIFVAVVRTNNVDSILIVTLLIATWALMKAVDRKKLGLLILSVFLIGVGFNIKMLQAYMVVPAIYLFYWIAVKLNWKKRLLHLAAAMVVLAGVSLSWALVVDSVPASERPYIGSSQTNSVLELAFGYNGIQRLLGQDNGTSTGVQKQDNSSSTNTSKEQTGQNQSGTAAIQAQGTTGAGTPPNFQDGGMDGKGGGTSGMFGTGSTGPLRLFSTELSGQISWLLPFILFAVIGLVGEYLKSKQFDIRLKFAAFWLAWLIPMMVFFSIAEFFHQYYLSMMGPAIAALVGIGWTILWNFFTNKEGWKSRLLPSGILVTFLFESLILNQNSQSKILVIGTVLVGAVLFVLMVLRMKKEAISPALPMAALLALLILPLYWTGITINKTNNASTPIAGPGSGISGMRGGQFAGKMGGNFVPGSTEKQDGSNMTPPTSQQAGSIPASAPANIDDKGMDTKTQLNTGLLSYLEKNYDGEKYFLATDSTQSAAPYILNTDYAVMAMGGFSGSDPALTPAKLEEMAKSGYVKYFLISGRGGRGLEQSQSVTQWIKDNCVEVPSSKWQSDSSSQGQTSFGPGGGDTLYVYKG
ncbi:glycosyltransferase family 39 protein [Neobacillus cucumis]|uniref:glycosyltransferase family 39 protein n=1 Tax=Neobacillus cucumis TaxID=1740721 RepID=UPI00203FA162|nr:glycosyltransferase family 39 protein [Neobacillus cucumis]MCM3727167.1 glycosyltransferase family 39 protein [Neobacillus cucumis]